MCQNQVSVPQEVTDVVNEFVEAGKIFTAYDVTIEARKRTRQNVRHQSVRQYISDFMNNQVNPKCVSYCVTTITLDVPGSPTPLCWYPQGFDAYDHPMALKPSAASQPDGSVSSAPATTNVQGGTVAPFDKEVVNITAEGRLEIPKSILGQLPSITNLGGTIDIMFNGSVYPKKQNDDGRIRLGNQVVSKVGKTTFKVSVDAAKNCVVVEPV